MFTHTWYLATVQRKLKQGGYGSNMNGFVYDMRMIFMNAVTYNFPSQEVYSFAIKTSNYFENVLEQANNISVINFLKLLY